MGCFAGIGSGVAMAAMAKVRIVKARIVADLLRNGNDWKITVTWRGWIAKARVKRRY